MNDFYNVGCIEFTVVVICLQGALSTRYGDARPAQTLLHASTLVCMVYPIEVQYNLPNQVTQVSVLDCPD